MHQHLLAAASALEGTAQDECFDELWPGADHSHNLHRRLTLRPVRSNSRCSTSMIQQAGDYRYQSLALALPIPVVRQAPTCGDPRLTFLRGVVQVQDRLCQVSGIT